MHTNNLAAGAFLLLVLFLSACSKKAKELSTIPLQTSGVDPADLNLTIIKDNATADGSEFVEVLLKAGPSVLARGREATVEIAPSGTLANGSSSQKLTVDAGGEARIFARSTVQGPVTIKATMGEITKQISVQFLPSWPEHIFVEPDSVFLAAVPGVNTSIRIRLSRASGTLTPGHTVHLYDSTENNTSVGTFLNTSVSNSAGIATTQYWLQDTSYHKNVYLKAYVNTPSGRVLGTGRIRIR